MSKLSILLITVSATDNLVAISWPSFNFGQTWQTLASFTRPQLNTEWIRQLPSRWPGLTPAQRNIVLSIALVGLGVPGIAYQYIRQQQASRQSQRDALPFQPTQETNKIIQGILESVNEIDSKINDMQTICMLDHLLYHDIKSLKQSLHEIEYKLDDHQTYNDTLKHIEDLEAKIDKKKIVLAGSDEPTAILLKKRAEERKQREEEFAEFLTTD